MADDLSHDRFSSALAGRLLRRATWPVGVIDVRGSQERYERAISWPRQHVSLLNRWVSRYGNEAQQDPGADHLAAALHMRGFAPAVDVPLPARANVPAHPVSSGQSLSLPDVGGTRPAAGRRDAAPRDEVHIGPAMRAAPLARARAPLASRSATPTAGASPAVADAGFERRSDSVRGDVVAGSAMRAVAASETTTLPLVARATSSATKVDIQPAAGAGVAAPIASDASARDGSTSARLADEASVVSASPDTRRQRSTTTATPHAMPQATTLRAPEMDRPALPSSSVLVQRRLAAPEVRTAATVTSPTPIELTVARPRAPIATAVPAIPAPVPGHAVVGMPSSSTTDGSTPTSSSQAGERARTLGADQTQGVLPRVDIVRTPAKARPLATAQPLLLSHPATPLIQRVPAADPSSSELVWRTAGVPSQPGRSRAAAFLPAAPSTIARAPGSDGGSTTSSSVAAAEAIGAGRRGPDASQLMEQVTRRLLRQIAVERERRGGSRWP